MTRERMWSAVTTASRSWRRAVRASLSRRSIPEMDERQERRARNESLFREVNERIEKIQQGFAVTGESEFICECDQLDCAQRFEMSLREYKRLRADPTTFAVAPGHQALDVEDVI